MTALCLLCAIVAFTLLALSADNHHQRWFGNRPDKVRRRSLRAPAWVAIMLCFPLALCAQGWVYGPILWTGILMLGAGAVFLMLNFMPGKRL